MTAFNLLRIRPVVYGRQHPQVPCLMLMLLLQRLRKLLLKEVDATAGKPIVLRGVRHIISVSVSVSVSVVCLPYQEAANCIFMAHKYCIMAHSWPSESVSSLSKCVGSICAGRYPVK